MRFIAILGLCLAAIFSLVNGAQYEQSKPETVAAEPLAAKAKLKARQAVPPTPRRQPVPQPAPRVTADPQVSQQDPAVQKAEETGFSLEFESSDVLHGLLAAGQVKLFASADGRFYGYRREGSFRETEAPSSYYQMHAETVPLELRHLAQGLYGGDLEWGVTLPPATVDDIQRLMSGRRGGKLFINADAGVGLADSAD
jgi:hypothetical protein